MSSTIEQINASIRASVNGAIDAAIESAPHVDGLTVTLPMTEDDAYTVVGANHGLVMYWIEQTLHLYTRTINGVHSGDQISMCNPRPEVVEAVVSAMLAGVTA